MIFRTLPFLWRNDCPGYCFLPYSEAKKAHSQALQDKMQLQVNYAEVVPKVDYINLQNINVTLAGETKRLESALSELKREKK